MKMKKHWKCWLPLVLLLVLLQGALGEELPREQLTQEQLMSFYENSVFVGDSITRQLNSYMKTQRKKDSGYFAGVKFVAAQSLSLYRASRNSLAKSGVNLTYQGTEMPLCRILEKMKPRRAMVLLGLNDYVGENIEQGVHNAKRIVELNQRYSPETEIIFFSLTPVTKRFSGRKHYQQLWDEYNAALEKMCREEQGPFIDIATRLNDEEGFLYTQYSSDGRCHLNAKGLKLWVDALLEYAQAQYDQGLWKP